MPKFGILRKLSSKLLLFILLFSVLACSTQRKRGEIGKIGKMYHNTTAKYNGYFNANELIKESILDLSDMHETNYAAILPVYDYVAVENPTQVADNLDLAIEKVTTVTALHEASHWVDDCYVLMGKAQYLKHDYESAQETLEYFEEQFDPKNPYGRNYERATNNTRSKKDRKRVQKEREQERKDQDKVRKDAKKEKEKERAAEKKARDKAKKEREKNRKKGIRTPKVEKPKTETSTKSTTTKKTEKEEEPFKLKEEEEKKKDDSYSGGMFKHRPAYYEGMLWLSRTYIERERYQSAERILDEIQKASSLSKEIQRELPAAYAHLYIQKGEYDDAVASLSTAIEHADNKTTKARYNFIAAQIYEKNGDIAKANAAYDKSMKLSQDYDLAFNAQVNKIKAAHANGSSSSDASLKKLGKMLSESKNVGYEGEIYYSRAEIYMEDDNIPAAQSELQYALASGGNSQTIQTSAYYKLGKIFYDKENYVESKNYFDSTLMVINEKDPRYFEVSNFSKNLDDIVANIEIIKLQDSLLHLSTLSKEKIKELAPEIIKARELEVESSREEGKETRTSSGPSRVLAGGRSTFFAYNPLSKNSGKTNFKRVWGQRALDDNWRRSLRNEASDIEYEEEELIEQEEEIEVSEEDLARIMKDIPRSPEAKKLAHNRIMLAMMELGVLYRDRLQNYEKSAEVLEKLIKRFPDYEDKDQALYYLYLSYNDMGKSNKASGILSKLKSEFPNSQFTRLATDPSYAKELIKDENQVQSFYDQTLILFNNDNHKKVISRANEAAGTFGEENELMPKFSLLKAMSMGNVKGEKEYIQELEILIKRYPNTPEEVRANEILRFLKGDAAAFDDVLYEEANELFEKAPDMLHYGIVVLYELPKKRIDKVKISVSDFNKKYHRLDNLKISNITLNRENKSQIIMIRGFESEEKAMVYFKNGLQNSEEMIRNEKKTGYDFFICTQKNFRELIKQKTVAAYRVFFEANYLDD